VHRSGSVKTNPASPSVSGNAPRSLAITGMPLAGASAAARSNDYRTSDSTSTNSSRSRLRATALPR
jgi:hypothetical protein